MKAKVTVKVKDLKAMFALNREIMGSNQIKQKVESPLGTVVSAQRNMKAAQELLKKMGDQEEDIKKAAAKKGEDNVPVIIDTPQGKIYDIPKENQQAFNDEIQKHYDSTVDIEVEKFNEATCDKIVQFLFDEKGCTAVEKMEALLDHYCVIKK